MAQVTGYNRHKWEVQRFDQCVEDAQKILIRAADEWCKGDPELPSTQQILNELLEVFVMQGFLKKPYGGNTK